MLYPITPSITLPHTTQEYTVVRDQWVKAKNERKRLEESLKQLQAEMQPLKDKHKEKEGELNNSKQQQQVGDWGVA